MLQHIFYSVYIFVILNTISNSTKLNYVATFMCFFFSRVRVYFLHFSVAQMEWCVTFVMCIVGFSVFFFFFCHSM